MVPSRRVRPFARWSIVGAVGLMAAALVATAWFTRANVRSASSTVIAGQGNALAGAVRADLIELTGPPTDDDLTTIVADHHASGLRYLAILDAAGHPVAAGGTSAPGRPRLEFSAMRGGPRPPPPRPGRARPPRIVIEFEPSEAAALEASANRTFAIGVLVALALLAIAGVTVRQALGREAAERAEALARERQRHLAGLGELSAVLAHEIRNPLASLKGNAQLLAELLPADDKPGRKAARVVDEALRLEELTNDLLAYVRTGELSRQPTDPAALLRAAATAMPAVTDDALALDVDRAPATWSLDAARIRQVLINLISNALDAGAPVRAAIATERGHLVVTIDDCGPGIADDDAERIFEPFFTKKTHGTGLGLAVARRVVEQHGGTLTASNRPSGGARFRVEIPSA